MTYYYQSLENHINEGVKCLGKIYQNRVKDYMENLLDCYCPECKNNLLDWLKLSFVFHDFGKIFYFPKNDKLIFYGHEWISTYYLDKYLNLWIEENLNNTIDLEQYKKLRYISLFSVLYHHHAMNILERAYRLIFKEGYFMEEFNKVKVFCFDQKIDNIFRNVSNLIYKPLQATIFYDSELIKKFTENLTDTLKNYKEKITVNKDEEYETFKKSEFCLSVINYVKELNRVFWKLWLSDATFKKIALLFLDIILYCDNMSSRFINMSENYPSDILFFARLTTKEPEKEIKGFPRVIMQWGKIYSKII